MRCGSQRTATPTCEKWYDIGYCDPKGDMMLIIMTPKGDMMLVIMTQKLIAINLTT